MKTNTTWKSKCCNADFKTVGMPDFVGFVGDDTGEESWTTIHCECLKCGKPCDIVEVD